MKRFNSIKKYGDFQKVYKTGKSYANRLFDYVCDEDGGGDRYEDRDFRQQKSGEQRGAPSHYKTFKGELPTEQGHG